MSTQAIGAAAAGTAILGGGGATIAYAAGAFDGEKGSNIKTYANFLEYVQGDESGRVFLVEAEIKDKLDESGKEPDYKNLIKGNLTNMASLASGVDKPSDSDFTSTEETSKTKIVTFTNKWCEVRKSKSLSEEQGNKKLTKNEIEANSEWALFKIICTKEKAVTQI
ncbi:hypothetical protein MHSWG343_07080 [Candidatus Mycoplasma haematohominis]|uniref:Uncharacterized protein n=1 Tax=Candidatus Mycoplasma haematohominis TaxID=1494318 RepID=A0A478FQ96_9MOLU|nr:hypothetical protein MHSWG343_07080 [Candidatus Mycoplasma haemohominis]